MVALLDTHILFQDPAGYTLHRGRFESRAGTGGGRVITMPLDGSIVQGIDAARQHIGGAPLGVVTSTEADALEAIEAGADDAAAIDASDEAEVTKFLDRIRTRAGVRQEDERRHRDFIHAEKLTALGSVVAGVAHEVNNPLSTIALTFDIMRGRFLSDLTIACRLRDMVRAGEVPHSTLRKELSRIRADSDDLAELLEDVTGATETVAELVRDLRVFSRSDAGEHSVRFSPQKVIEQALRLVRKEFGPKTVVEFDLEADVPELFLPKNRLAQVLTNLLLNAAHATREVERDIHRIRVGARIDDQHLAISISDTGPGIPEDSLEKIFDPFFTTKREGQGTGLGLSISRSILQHMGGDLVVSSVDGAGATFVCFLPLPDEVAEESALRRKPTLELQVLTRTPAVLLVDDDARVLRTTTRILQEKFKVLIARDGSEACELLQSGSNPDVIVMELALPELDGVGVYKWLEVHRPHLTNHVVFFTAAQERPAYHKFLSERSLPVLLKPASVEDILGMVTSVVPEASTPREEASNQSLQR